MIRRARNLYASLLLVLVGVVIALATSAVVVAPRGTEEPTADSSATGDTAFETLETTAAPTTTTPPTTTSTLPTTSSFPTTTSSLPHHHRAGR